MEKTDSQNQYFVCPNCQSEIADNAPICWKCGLEFETNLAEESPATTKFQHRERESSIFSFEGRIPRSKFWNIIIVLWLFSMFLGFVIGATAEASAGVVLIFLMIPIAWVSLATQVKRWHDRDRSGWMVLINFIPILGWLWAFIELGFFKGTEGENQFGPDPLGA